MPYKCCVPACRGNYDENNKAHVFKFPKDEQIRAKWIAAIPRKDFAFNENSRVCEKHFHKEMIINVSSACDERTGRIISVSLKRPRLKTGAIPQIFEGLPTYFSKTKVSNRISPERKKMDKEASSNAQAISESLLDQENYDKSRSFKCFNELVKCVHEHNCSEFWSLFVKNENVMYLNIINSSNCISLNYALLITPDLSYHVSLNGQSVPLNIPDCPKQLSHMNEVFKILDYIEMLTKPNVETTESLLSLLLSLLNSYENVLNNENTRPIFEFIIDQLSLLRLPMERYRYSSNALVFSTLINLISPVAYRFVRQAGNFILPHPTTIQKLSAKINACPQNEQSRGNFLAYARTKFNELKEHEHAISLMIDEIHLKSFLDFKSGNVVGVANESVELATSAYVFMLQSFLSSFKDVVHIMPAKDLAAEPLFVILKKVIVGLEAIGFKVIVVVSDNISINRKCMSFFNDENCFSKHVYPHPCDPSRPLFYCVDSVHLIKCVRNNWINQKNPEQAMYYPPFDLSNEKLLTASFLTVKQIYEAELGHLLKRGYTLSRKALWPNNLERQNVPLCLQVFNENICRTLTEFSEKPEFLNSNTTSSYIDIFTQWFSIMNVKTPNKGIRSRNVMCQPLTFNAHDERLVFLYKFVDWLEKWKLVNSDTGRLTNETHSALIITTLCIIELTRYCVTELNMRYVLPGKVQTDALEYRFGLYRRMAGTQYHISLRQVFEVEKKLRTCSLLNLTFNSKLKGTIVVKDFNEDIANNESEESVIEELFDVSEYDISVTETDFTNLSEQMPIILYLAGYCTHTLLKRLKCNDCLTFLTIERELAVDPKFNYIHNCDRGGLKYPDIDVINAVAVNFIVVKKIVGGSFEKKFLSCGNQRKTVLNICISVLENKDMSIVTCSKHKAEIILKQLLRSATNTLLKNYCKNKNDIPKLNKTKDKTTIKTSNIPNVDNTNGQNTDPDAQNNSTSKAAQVRGLQKKRKLQTLKS